MSALPVLLVVEDDAQMRMLLERGLSAEGYDVRAIDNGVEALIAARTEVIAGSVIDVMLPGMSGFEVCRRLRESDKSFPILLLTARDAVEDRVFGLDSGADDYLTKPFDFAELSARVRAMLRRNLSQDRMRISVGRLILDSEVLRVSRGDTIIPTSPKEFALLRLLAQDADAPVSRARILDIVWGGVDHIDPNIVDQYISYLRHKLDPDECGFRIVTVRGSGYRIESLD
ncbi:MAG TPA: response regulator transcription factor [Galbitalea sp.]|jgi:two-component system OmpR family response regulator|nr:response regulator transcription factor [Galbitalea sp.]